MRWSGRFRCLLAAAVMALSAFGGALFVPSVTAQEQLRARLPAGVGAARPALVITLAPMNKLSADISYVAEQVGQGQAGAMFTAFATANTQGIDPARPTGVFVHMVDGGPQPVGVLPTADAEGVLKRLEGIGMIPPSDKLDDGTLVVAAGPTLVYIRQAGPWAIIAQNPEILNLVPADPASLMSGLGDRFDLGVRLDVQQVPVELREMLVDQLAQGFEQAMAQQQPSGGEAVSLGNAQLEQIQQVIRESERLQFGLNIDPAKRHVLLETVFAAVPGSPLANMTNAQQPIPSKFSAVLRGDTAVRYHSAASVSPEAAESTLASLEILGASLRNFLDGQTDLPEAEKAEIEELAAELFTIMGKSVSEGKYDFGMMGVAGADTLKLAGGMFVHDGADVAALLKKVAAKVPPAPDAPKFTFDAGNYKGVSLHTVTLDVPAKEGPRRLFGEQLKLVVGTASQAVYFAFGTGADVALRALIDTADSDTGNLAERGLGQMRVKLLPFLQLAHSINPDDTVAALIAELSKVSDLDFVSVDAFPIQNGQRSSIIVSEGLLRAIGVGIREGQSASMREMQRSSGSGF